MPLDELIKNAPARWTKLNAMNCWISFSEKYQQKYGSALHHALINGNLDKYIEHESKTFARYARMYAYRNKLN